MKIETNKQDSHALLKLSGEFDTFHVSKLSEEIDDLIAGRIYHVILNLRLIEFMNSTALGAILKTQKRLKEKGGDVVISRPSVFCKEILTRVGLDRLIKVFPTDEGAAQYLSTMYTTGNKDTHLSKEPMPEDLEDESSILIAFTDPAKSKSVGGHGVGRILQITETGMDFRWNGGKTGLKGDKLARIFSSGTELRLKFRIPLFKKGFFELPTSVANTSANDDGSVKVSANFGEMSSADKKAIQQFVQDVNYLKTELKKATKK